MHVKGSGLSTENIRSILLIQLGDIGDVVLSLPCVRALRECFPEAHLTVSVREKARDLMEYCSWNQDVISVDKKKRPILDELAYQKSFFSKIRARHFDLAIDLRTGTRGALLAFLSGARQRIGIYADDGKIWRNRLFSHLLHWK